MAGRNDLKFAHNSFDAILLSSVIQYVRDPLGTLKRINALLKENSILYIEVTNEDGLIFKIGNFFKSITGGKKMTTHLSPLFPSFQIYGFNKKALSKALELAGFEICYIKVKGVFGGGRVKGRGFRHIILSFTRKIVIFIGGLTGQGHLIYCLAKKR